MMESRKKTLYLELLRVFAILCVIFNHTDGFFSYYSSTQNLITWLYSAVLSVICRAGVPLFFMISGALLLNKEESIRALFQKRILRMGIVLILFSAIQYAVLIYRGRIEEYSISLFWKGILEGTIEETYWFLYAYLGILFLLPLLRKLVKGMKTVEFRYLLIFGLAGECGFRLFRLLFGIEVESQLYMLNLYLYFFLLGHYFEHGKDEILEKAKKYIYVVAGVTITLASASIWLDFCRVGSYELEILELWAPVLAIEIFLMVRNFCETIVLKEKVRNIILKVASCSFGIYLLEKLVRIILLPVYLYLSDKTVGIVSCSVYVVTTYLLAFAVTMGLKQVPGMRKLL